MVVGAVLVLYGAIRLNVQLPRKSLVAALLLLVLIGATISSARAVSGRESFLANHTAGDRLAALADGFVALPTAHSRQATVDAFAGRFDGNTFGALVGAGLDAGRPPVGFATVRNDVLLTVPSFLNPAKLDAPIEQRNEDAYFVKHFGLHFGTDYLPGLFGFMLGYLGKIGLPVLAALFGILFAFLDRWLLRRVNRARLLISFGLMESVLLACSCLSINSRFVRSRLLSPYARGWMAARIGLMGPSSGAVLSGVSARRVARGLRRPNWSSTIRPVVFSHSLSRGMSAACARSTNGAQLLAPAKAASTCGASSSITSRYLASAASFPISRSSACRRCHSHRYSSACGKRARTALVRP